MTQLVQQKRTKRKSLLMKVLRNTLLRKNKYAQITETAVAFSYIQQGKNDVPLLSLLSLSLSSAVLDDINPKQLQKTQSLHKKSFLC